MALGVGQCVSGHLAQTNAEVRYQLTLQNKLLLRLGGLEGQDFDLDVRYGAQAGTADGQYEAVSYVR